jgi:hypothetical protein
VTQTESGAPAIQGRVITGQDMEAMAEQKANEREAAQAPCEACTWWQEGHEQGVSGERFQLLMNEWNVTRARALIEDHGPAFTTTVDVEQLWKAWGTWIRTDAYHARHVHMDKPVMLAATFERHKKTGRLLKSKVIGYMLIDGWLRHRQPKLSQPPVTNSFPSVGEQIPMPQWVETIYLTDIWDAYTEAEGDALVDAFDRARVAVVERLKASAWVSHHRTGYPQQLDETIELLDTSEDVQEFDEHWGSLQDLADYDRVWLERILQQPPKEEQPAHA